MIIYNVTIQVTWAIHDAWFEWMKLQHIPEIMNTGLFDHYQMVKLIDTEEKDGPTYAIQYYALNESDYREYLEKHAELLRQKSFERWGDQFVAFRSAMEVIN
jgi:hypothetical protein